MIIIILNHFLTVSNNLGFNFGFEQLALQMSQINNMTITGVFICLGGGPSVVVSTAAFHARVRGSVPGLGG